MNNLTAHAFTTGRVYLKSDGTPWRPIIHIEDISRAFIGILDAPRQVVHNQAFNVGLTDENYQIRQIAEIVRDCVPGSRVEYAEGAGPDKRSYRVDFGKIAREIPAFKPKWNAVLGARQLYETYQRVGLSLDDFEGARYRRVDHIKGLLGSGRLDKTLRWSKKRETQPTPVV